MNSHLAESELPVHDVGVWRRPDPPLDRETVDDLIRKLMEIDTKPDTIMEYLGLTDDEEEDDA